MQLCYDSSANTLRLTLDGNRQRVEGVDTREIDGVIDVAGQGRLVGVEFRVNLQQLRPWLLDPISREHTTVSDDGVAYIQLTSGDDRYTRSAPVRLVADFDTDGALRALAIPRRGAGYEITYPSGNR